MTASIIATGNSLRGFTGPFIGDRVFINHAFKYFDYTYGDRLICRDKIDHKVDTKYQEWPHFENIEKHGGKWKEGNSDFQTEPPYVTNYNWTVAFAINLLFHLDYRKIYLLGCDGYVGDYVHFYDDKPPNRKQREDYETALNGRAGNFGGNKKILNTVEAFEEYGDVVFVESRIREGWGLERYQEAATMQEFWR